MWQFLHMADISGISTLDIPNNGWQYQHQQHQEEDSGTEGQNSSPTKETRFGSGALVNKTTVHVVMAISKLEEEGPQEQSLSAEIHRPAHIIRANQ